MTSVLKIFTFNTFLDHFTLYTQDYRTIYKIQLKLAGGVVAFFWGGGGGRCNGKDFYLFLLILYLGIKKEKEIILVGLTEVVAYFRNLQNYKNQQVVISVKTDKILQSVTQKLG